MQAISFKKTGNYISRQKDLLTVASEEERAVVETFLNLKNDGAVNFDEMSARLFEWSAKRIENKN